MQQPRIIVLAGPNGAGKTTFAREFLPREGRCLTFLNADLIAAGLSPFAVERAAVRAGRLMLEQLDRLAGRQDVAFETTLSGLGYVRRIHQWRASGYRVRLLFLGLDSSREAQQRVALRVSQGGHDIPVDVIHRRFEKGFRLFETVYKTIVDDWILYDNSGDRPVILESNLPPAAREPGPAYTEPEDSMADFVQGSFAALQRAAQRAREIAIQTNTLLVVARDGQVLQLDPRTMQPVPPTKSSQ